MTGYVRTYLPELKILEDRYYKAAYCGLCRSIGKNIGKRAEMLLNYDFTLLSLIRLAVLSIKPEFSTRRCVAHPLRKRLMMKENEALSYSAASSVLLAYGKIEDDIADEKGKKRLKAKMARAFFRPSYKKARAALPELDEFIKSKLSELSLVEKSSIASVDTPANIFAQITAEIFSFGTEQGGNENKILYEIGYAVGRWVYIVDALDDMAENKKEGKYNPFLLLYSGESLDGEKKADIEAALIKIINRAVVALDLVDFDMRRDLSGLINNILFEGMPRKAADILYGEKKQNLYEITNDNNTNGDKKE